MSTEEPLKNITKEIEQALAEAGDQQYVLRLYVAGMTPRSQKALANIRQICEENLHGRYELEVIDIYQQPELAKGEQIFAVPTLVKHLPAPLRKIIGDMSDTEKVIIGLNLKARES